MGDICDRLKQARYVGRFYVECEDCGMKVIDSARTNIPAGMPGQAEGMATTAIESHKADLGHSNYTAVVQERGSRPIAPEHRDGINLTVTGSNS